MRWATECDLERERGVTDYDRRRQVLEHMYQQTLKVTNIVSTSRRG